MYIDVYIPILCDNLWKHLNKYPLTSQLYRTYGYKSIHIYIYNGSYNGFYWILVGYTVYNQYDIWVCPKMVDTQDFSTGGRVDL